MYLYRIVSHNVDTNLFRFKICSIDFSKQPIFVYNFYQRDFIAYPIPAYL